MSKGWERPSDIPYPQVWFTFEAKDLDTDDNVEYVVQDLPPHLFDAALDHMTAFFMCDEPISEATGFAQDAVSMKEMRVGWQRCMQHKISVACFRKGSDEIVGLNMLKVNTISDEKSTRKLEGKALSKMVGAIMYVEKQYDVYSQCNVDKYITAFGLSVSPKFRRRGVGLQLLKARKFIGKAVGVNLTATVFTAGASQRIAATCGFTNSYEISYEQLANIDPELEFKNIKSDSLVYGVMQI